MSDKERIAREMQAADHLRARLKRHAMGPKGLPSLGRELGYAVTDIRQKVVEEATYGRAVTPPPIETGGIHGKAGEPAPDAGSVHVTLTASFRLRCQQAAREHDMAGPERGPARSPEIDR